MKKKIVKVEWVDAADDSRTWLEMDDLEDVVPITTIGILIENNKKRVVVAHSSCQSSRIGGIIYIPKGCVKKIEYLTDAKSNG